MTIGELDTLIDSMSPADYEREFGWDETAEQEDAFGPAGWTPELIAEYEEYLETHETPF